MSQTSLLPVEADPDELSRLRSENEALRWQVANDLEELTFLRSTAGLLEVCDLSFDLVALSEAILPNLRLLVEADSVVLVEAERPGNVATPAAPLAGPRVWSGLRCIKEADCSSLVDRFREAAGVQPVVRNHLDRTALGNEFPGIDSFILVPVVGGNTTLGWLLALNRNNARQLDAAGACWALSCLEFGTHEASLMSSTAAILGTHTRNIELFRERESLLIGVVRALVSAVEAKDDYTCGHSERVGLYARRIAREMGLDAHSCEMLYLTGLLHDVGKIGIRDAVLRKPGQLTRDEMEEIKQHPDKGWQILQDLTLLNDVLSGVLHHHEQYDGRGYPDRLAGRTIPRDGRILAVADAYDAMTSDRPYRKGMPTAQAESILRAGSGQQWDPEVVDAFFRCLGDLQTIKATYRPRELPRRQRRTESCAEPRSGEDGLPHKAPV